MALQGFARGFLVGAAALAGFIGGAYIGSRLAPPLLSGGSHSPYAALFSLGGAVLIGGLLGALFEGVARRVRRFMWLPGLRVVDGLLGAILTACIGLGLAWIIGAALLQTSSQFSLPSSFRRSLSRSVILRDLDSALPPSGPILNALGRIDPLPGISGRIADVPAPSARILRTAGVTAARGSVVRILGTACNLGIEGSGWVAGDGLVVTNAHVVAGERYTSVQPGGAGRQLPARVVVFDPHNDIAILRVPGLSARALLLQLHPSNPAIGESAAILGFPLNGPFRARPTRLGATQMTATTNAYGNPAVRLISSLRGLVQSGNSGGPLVDSAGKVIGTVFAEITNAPQNEPSGLAVPDSVVSQALAKARVASRPVSTESCAESRVAPDDRYAADPMSKTLVIAEKPSVGRDLSKVLPVPFTKGEGVLEGPDHIITWAVGHLVQLADPDEYDAKYAKWRMPDLPILPKKFKLVVRDERSKKQMTVVKRELDRDDVDLVVNACDAGREGELIFAYLYEKAASKLPVQRLWLNSMTNSAIKDAFASLRPSEEFHTLEEAARSRSEADWIVGMNATRAATIRLRSSFDGAVCLGRVQTPTLAILARREQEIRDFKPEPYWVVDARFLALAGGAQARIRRSLPCRRQTADRQPSRRPRTIVAACEGNTGTITKVEKRESKDRAPLLYDLTSLQRDASSRFGFTARRTLAAAQRLYEEHKALTYPRTNSRYITSDMIPDIKPIADLVGGQREYAAAAKYVTGLDVLPLGRVVNNEKVTDHHAIIPTLAERHPVDKMDDDDRRIYDLVVRRFLAVFHPEAVFENTRVETTVAEKHVFRTRGKLLLVPGWRGVYGEGVSADSSTANPDDDDEGADQQLPKLDAGRAGEGPPRSPRTAKETKPPRRYSDGSLLRRDGDRRQARGRRGAARGDEGLRHRYACHARGDHRAPPAGRLHRARWPRAGRHREGHERDPPARRPRSDLAVADRRMGAPAGEHRDRRGHPQGVHGRYRQVRRGDRQPARHDAQGCAHPARQPRSLPGLRSGHRREPQGLLLLVARGSGLRLRDLEGQGRQEPDDGHRQGADQDGPHGAAGHRLQEPRRQELPLAAGVDADRGGSLAGRVRRAVGQGGRQAARGR